MKKEKLVRILERRRIISFDELVQALGSINTTKHYIMELKRFGVIKARDTIKVGERRIVAYYISKKGLEAYKEELKRRKEKKREIARNLYRLRQHSSS